MTVLLYQYGTLMNQCSASLSVLWQHIRGRYRRTGELRNDSAMPVGEHADDTVAVKSSQPTRTLHIVLFLIFKDYNPIYPAPTVHCPCNCARNNRFNGQSCRLQCPRHQLFRCRSGA